MKNGACAQRTVPTNVLASMIQSVPAFSSLWGLLLSIFIIASLTVTVNKTCYSATGDPGARATAQSGGTSGGSSGGNSADNFIFTGSATYTIPIEVPPGRLGLAPHVSLIYNSQGGNGILGMGWSLDLGSIQRSTTFGLNYNGNDFVYTKDGSSVALVNYSGNEYRLKMEDGSFMKFFKENNNSWRVVDKKGSTYSFGTLPTSRQSNSFGTFKWNLDRVQDANENYMTLTYWTDPTLNELYLTSITYTGNTDGTAPSNTVTFYYEGRQDSVPNYASNVAVTMQLRLKSIDIFANGSRARLYQLNYSNSSSTGRSLLTSVQQFADAYPYATYMLGTGAALPPWNLQYQTGATGFAQNSASGVLDPGYDDSRDWADINGDGKLDFCRVVGNTGSTFLQCTTSAGSGFGPTYSSGTIDPGYEIGRGWVDFSGANFTADGKSDFCRHAGNTGANYLVCDQSTGSGFQPSTYSGVIDPGAEPGRQWADFTGDGKADFCRVVGNTGSNFLKCTGLDANGIWQTYSSGVIDPGSEEGRAWVDVTGDGKADFCRIVGNTASNFLQCTGVDAYGIWQTYSSGVIDPGYDYSRAWVDFNGDGKADFCRIVGNTGANYLQCTVSTGVGFGPTYSSNYLDPGAHEGRAWVDFNGDGKADFCRIVGNTGANYVQCTIWTENGFTQTYSSTVIDPGALSGRAWVDVSGDGKADFCRIVGNTGSNFLQCMHTLFPQTAPKDDLLTYASTPLGGSTTISYTSSTIYPNTQLPFAIPVVYSLSINDGFGNIAPRTYEYASGYYDIQKREFLGFGYIKQTNPDATTVETWFHQKDASHDSDFKGKPYQVLISKPWSGSVRGETISHAVLDWNAGNTQLGTYPVFVKLRSKTTTNYIGGVAVPQAEENYYDEETGNLLTHIILDSPSGNPNKGVTTKNEYVDVSYYESGQLKKWLLRTASSKVYDGVFRDTVSEQIAPIRRTDLEYYYESPESHAGNLKAKTLWNDQGASPRVSMEYWPNGNVRKVIDANANALSLDYGITTTYDSASKTYPVEVIRPNGLTASAEYDYRFGVPKYQWDENNNLTETKFDSLGRIIEKTLHDGELTTDQIAGRMTFEYHTDVFPNYVKTSILESASGQTIDKYEFVDGLGRPIQTITFGEPEQGQPNQPKKIVSKTFYDTMGRVWVAEGPFFSNSTVGYPMAPPAEFPWVMTTYDYAGRPVQIERPDGEHGAVVSLISYAGLSTTFTDPDGHRKTETKDFLGRLVEVKEENATCQAIEQSSTDTSIVFGVSGDKPIAGDFLFSDLAGRAKVGVFHFGTWYLDMDGNGVWNGPVMDESFASFGGANDYAVVGDWGAIGRATIGVYNAGNWCLDYNGDGICSGNPTDRWYTFGFAGATPAVGDWSGDGKTKIGVYDPATSNWYLDKNGSGTWNGTPADSLFNFGFPGAVAIVGDWTGNGITKIGVYDPTVSYWYLDWNGNGVWDGEPADKLYHFGIAGAQPVTGDWTGDGKSKIGVFKDGVWYLDRNGNGIWDPGTSSGGTTTCTGVVETYTTTYTYNAAGNLLSVTDTNGKSTTMTYNTLGQKKSMQDMDMGSWQYQYDANGNLIWQSDANTKITEFTYDELNRIKTKTYPNATDSDNNLKVKYAYDDPTPQKNGLGRLHSIARVKDRNGIIDDPVIATTYNAYDESGKVLSQTELIDGASYTTVTECDLSGKPTKLTYPDGFFVTNSFYPGTGLLHTVTGSDGKVYSTLTGYEPTGKIGTMEYSITDAPDNPIRTVYNYDVWSTKLKAIKTKPIIGNTIIDRSYNYSHAGDILKITDFVEGADRGVAGGLFEYTYSYDGLHRLLKERTTGNAYPEANFTYDPTGNILTKTTGTSTLTYQYTNPAHVHAVSRITANGTNYDFVYDANGNMTFGWDLTDLANSNVYSRQIEYNVDNKPMRITYRGSVSTFTYDGNGGRVKKENLSGSGTTIYVGRHFEVTNGQAVKYIFAGSERVAKVTSAGAFYFHGDHLGSAAVLTNAKSGVIEEETKYHPFGGMREHSGSTVSNYKFTGQEYDPETGLYYYGARYYDPTIGRFLSPDTIVPNFRNPQDLNRYSYVNNNPLIYTDPTGHVKLKKFIKTFVSAFLGAIVTVLTSGAAGAIIAGMLGGAVAGGTSAALDGGNFKAILKGAAFGAVLGGVGGGIYSIPGVGMDGVYGMAAAGAVYATAKGGLNGLAYYAGGVLGGLAGGILADAVMNGNSQVSTRSQSQGNEQAGTQIEISGDEFVSDLTVSKEFDAAFKDSKPGIKGGHEECGAIYRYDNKNEVVRFKPGDRGSCSITGLSDYFVAPYHTHPNYSWNQGPSPRDFTTLREISTELSRDIPGYIINRHGIIRYHTNETWGYVR